MGNNTVLSLVLSHSFQIFQTNSHQLGYVSYKFTDISIYKSVSSTLFSYNPHFDFSLSKSYFSHFLSSVIHINNDPDMVFKHRLFKTRKSLNDNFEYLIYRCRFFRCSGFGSASPYNSGGALFIKASVTNSIINITESSFRSCRAPHFGGSVYYHGANCTILKTEFINSSSQIGSIMVLITDTIDPITGQNEYVMISNCLIWKCNDVFQGGSLLHGGFHLVSYTNWTKIVGNSQCFGPVFGLEDSRIFSMIYCRLYKVSGVDPIQIKGRNCTIIISDTVFQNINTLSNGIIIILASLTKVAMQNSIFKKSEKYYLYFANRGLLYLKNCYTDREDRIALINVDFSESEFNDINEIKVHPYQFADIREWQAAGGSTVTLSMSFSASQPFSPSHEFTDVRFDMYEKDWALYKKTLKATTAMLLTTIIEDVVLSL